MQVVPERLQADRAVAVDVHPANLEEAAERTQQCQAGGDELAGQRVEDEVHPLAAGAGTDFLGEIHLAGAENMADALGFEELALGGTSHRGENLDARQPGQLRCCQANTARGSVDQNFLPDRMRPNSCRA